MIGVPSSTVQINAGRTTALEHTVPAKPELAWPALLEAYQEVGLTVNAIDERNRVVGVRGQRATRRLAGERLSSFFDCGSNMTGVIADSYHIDMDVISVLTPSADGGTRIRTSTTASAMNPQGSSANAVPCGSNGTLETRIAALLRIRSTIY